MSSSDYITGFRKAIAPLSRSRVSLENVSPRDDRDQPALRIRTPKDLEGKRVGVMRYTMTAAVWQRGHLQTITASIFPKSTGSKARSIPPRTRRPDNHPAGRSVERNESDKSMSDLLEEGKVDRRSHPPAERAVHQSRYRAPLFRFQESRKRITSAPASSRSCTSSRSSATCTRSIRSSRGVSIARFAIQESRTRAHAQLLALRLCCRGFLRPRRARQVFGEDPWTYGRRSAPQPRHLMKYMVQQRC